MKALLTDNMPLLSGAPNGIKKLRELILELAMRGKLVPQDPSDEPARELLKRVAEEKARLEADGKIKKQKTLAAIAEDDHHFELPSSWEWASTAALTLLITDGTHHTPTYINSGIPFISVKDIDGATIIFDNCKYISQEEHVAINSRCNPEHGDILLCRIGTLGRPTIVDTKVPFSLFVSVGLLKLPKETEISRYFHCALSSPLMYRQYDQIKAGGSHTNKLNLGDIPRLLVPVPPLAEQHRIVAKVDELMALCDILETRQAGAESAHAEMIQALLDGLIQASDTADFDTNWQRLAKHFHTLFTTEPSIDALKQTLLQLAVMGKLVPQNPSDEPASELLKRIAEEKARLVAGGRIKKQKSVTEIGDEEKPFQLPAGWEWVRLDSLLKKLGAGSTPLGGKQSYISAGIKFLRSQNVWNEGLRLDDVALIPESTHQKMSGTHVEAGDLLFNITGASIGRCALIPDDFDTGNVSQHVTIVRPVASELRYFLHVILTSRLVQKTVMDVQVGVSREGLSIGKLSMFVIPCPPEAEQHRIVAKVDQLMALCHQLKTRLTQARQLNEQLASTVVEQTVT